MKLVEAIEIVERWYAGGFATEIKDMNPAIQLLIEAGKYIQYQDNCPGINTRLLLPGETKD